MTLLDELGNSKLIWDKTGIAFNRNREKVFVTWNEINKISIRYSNWKSFLLSFYPYKEKTLMIDYKDKQSFDDEFGQKFLFDDSNSNVNQGLIKMAKDIKPEVLDQSVFKKAAINRFELFVFILKWLILGTLAWTIFWVFF